MVYERNRTSDNFHTTEQGAQSLANHYENSVLSTKCWTVGAALDDLESSFMVNCTI